MKKLKNLPLSYSLSKNMTFGVKIFPLKIFANKQGL